MKDYFKTVEIQISSINDKYNITYINDKSRNKKSI
jgi:hypothetical protein